MLTMQNTLNKTKKKKKKKVNLQIITPSVEETNYFVC